MKFIHISDIHIGKRLNEFSLIEDQKFILKRIADIAKEEQADAIIIAGDIYDKSTPSAEAVVVFDEFINSLSETGADIFIISGNHDGAERLSFGKNLLKKSRVFISGTFKGIIDKYELCDEYGSIFIHLLPFIKPAHIKAAYDTEEQLSYNEAVKMVMEKNRPDTGMRNVLVAHQFVTGAKKGESEDINVGGIDNIDREVFKDFDYVALGHIHRPQNIGSRIRYCGTPLKYSFSESEQEKSVTVVELSDKKSEPVIRTIPLVPLKDLRKIKGTYEELVCRNNYEGTDCNDYIYAVLTDEEEIPGVMKKLGIIYPNIMQLSYENTRTKMNASIELSEEVEKKTEGELFEELFIKQNNRELNDEERDYLNRVLQELEDSPEYKE